MQHPLDRVFVGYSAAKLEQLSGRIVDCLGRLSAGQIWARGSDNENAVGNLVLHLCGNLRQWIGFGVAGKPDIRVRDREFRARGSLTGPELVERLEAEVAEAGEIIHAVSGPRLAEKINVQRYEVTVLEAIFHVVEHFAQHTGQIIFATKLLTRENLGYYDHLSKGSGHNEKTP